MTSARQISYRLSDAMATTTPLQRKATSSISADRPSQNKTSSPPNAKRPIPVQHSKQASTSTNASTSASATWAEMQNTLSEVELSAAGGASAFNPAHTRALEELRKAQIALAQAWGRSEVEDEAADAEGSVGDGAKASVGGGVMEGTGMKEEDKERGKLKSGSVLEAEKAGAHKHDGSAADARGREGSGTEGATAGGRSQLEEETENDILLARKRRQANDRYFERVNRGVVDVVEKLEAVAKRMRDVEMETQDLWEEGSSGSNSPT